MTQDVRAVSNGVWVVTAHNDEDLPTLQGDVERLLGRCLLRLQQYERPTKSLVSHHAFSGHLYDLAPNRTRQVERTARKALGTLVGELVGTYVIRERFNPPEQAMDTDEDVNWIMPNRIAFAGGWIVDCNNKQQHSGLRMRPPSQFIAVQTATA